MFEPSRCTPDKKIHVFKQDAIYGDYCTCGDTRYEPAAITKLKDYTQCQPYLHMFAGYPKNGDICKCGEKVWQSYSLTPMAGSPEREEALAKLKEIVNRAGVLAAEINNKIGVTKEEAQKKVNDHIAKTRRKHFTLIQGGKVNKPNGNDDGSPPPNSA